MKSPFPLLLAFTATLSSALTAAPTPAAASSRLKDIVSVEGVRENKLVGYGLVVGLNGTGDSVRNTPELKQSFQAALEKLGVNTRDATMDSKNIAAVFVTANLPAFVAPGSQIDVTVSAVGDAKSLLGGTLVVTPLQGLDGEVYAVAQGTVQTGSISAGGASGSSITRGVPTSGKIANGAEVERDTGFKLASLGAVRLTLHNPDFTTATRVAEVVNRSFPGTASADNSTIVTVTPPKGADLVSYLTRIEQLAVEADAPAKVVVDEVNGVIVMGANVRISTVAIAQGNLTISVSENPQVSQPNPLGQGQTVVTPQTAIKVKDDKGKGLIVLPSGASLQTLVKGLNTLGVSPRDMINILQTIKAAGALQADIEVM